MSDDDLTLVWKALSHPIRRAILDMLREQPRTTGELAAAFEEVSRYAVMDHIGVLKDADLVVVRARGRERWHYLNAVPLQTVYDRWLSPYTAEWASSLIQLKRHVEGTKGHEQMAQSAETMIAGLEGFETEQEISIDADPERVFDALTADVSAWWNLRRYEDSPVFVLDPQVGGTFRELFNDAGDGVLYATVTEVRRGEYLRLVGPMGMPEPTLGVVEYTLQPHASGTRLMVSHRGFGVADAEMRSNYDAGWQMLLGRLKEHVER